MSLPMKDFPRTVTATLAFGRRPPLLLDLRESVALLTALAAAQLHDYGAAAGKVTVWLETAPDAPGPQGREQGRSATLPIPVSDPRLLALFTRDVVDEVYHPGVSYQLAGVCCEALVVDDRRTGTPSAMSPDERTIQLDRVITCIRERYGEASITVDVRQRTSNNRAAHFRLLRYRAHIRVPPDAVSTSKADLVWRHAGGLASSTSS